MAKKKQAQLSKQQLEKLLKRYPDWSVNAKQTQLSKTFTFNNFVDALVFVARIAVHAEVLNHHPDIELSYGKVKVKITTHAIKNLSKLDEALLERIETIPVKGA